MKKQALRDSKVSSSEKRSSRASRFNVDRPTIGKNYQEMNAASTSTGYRPSGISKSKSKVALNRTASITSATSVESESELLIEWNRSNEVRNSEELLRHSSNESVGSLAVNELPMVYSNATKHSSCETVSSVSTVKLNVDMVHRIEIIDIGSQKMSKPIVKEKLLNENTWLPERAFEIVSIYKVQSSIGTYVNCEIDCDDQLYGTLLSSGFIYFNDRF